MDEKRDILTSEELHRNPYKVPQGYFEDLQERLQAIGAETPARENTSVFRKISPYIAVAATFIIMVSAGTFFLRKTTPEPMVEDEYEAYIYDYLVPFSDPDAVFYAMNDEHEFTDEELAEYLDYIGVDVEEFNENTDY